MTAYYNEHDPDAAAELRVLISEGLIAPGIVDERSIEDVRPDELAGYAQCHFFAGIGVWSLALRQAGWPDDRPVWTGSCPCQPFSAAGKGDGFADERHLWPHFFHLISQCKPPEILGEQVAAKAVEPWIDLVHADMEAVDYAFGCVPFPAAGVGAPHIRDRAYWAAVGVTPGDANSTGLEGRRGVCGRSNQWAIGAPGLAGELANPDSGGHIGRWSGEAGHGRDAPRLELERLCDAGGLDNAISPGRDPGRDIDARNVRQQFDPAGELQPARPGPTNGLWRAADWLLCRDAKWRPVEPGTFPLAHAGAFRNRVATLRGAGNAINLAAAQAFIEAVMSATPGQSQGGAEP